MIDICKIFRMVKARRLQPLALRGGTPKTIFKILLKIQDFKIRGRRPLRSQEVIWGDLSGVLEHAEVIGEGPRPLAVLSKKFYVVTGFGEFETEKSHYLRPQGR